jgi:hypothetical protein
MICQKITNIWILLSSRQHASFMHNHNPNLIITLEYIKGAQV